MSRPCGSPTIITLITVIALIVITSPVGAAADPARHVRTLDRRVDALIEEGARRSSLFQSLLQVIERSNVIVYVESRMLPAGLVGRLTFAGAAPGWRYLRVGIECRQSRDAQ